MFLRTLFAILGLLLVCRDVQAAPWPGGLPADVTPKEFGANVSAVEWDSRTESLWTAENSPGVVCRSVYDEGRSRWVAVQAWQPGDDLEALALRDFDDTTLFVGVERDANNHRLIREYDTATFALLREWDLVAMRFGPANDGLEALAFVPDSTLTAMHFVDVNGLPYEHSQFGTGGLFFAGHQDTGQIFVFDVDRSGTGINLPHVHVTTFATGQNEIAALDFDPSNGLLYAWHDAGIDKLQAFHSDGQGHFTSVVVWDNPFCCNWNIEGMAIVDGGSCGDGRRAMMFARDQTAPTAPSLYEDLQFPCDCNGNGVADATDLQVGSSIDLNQSGIPDECEGIRPSARGDEPALTFRLHGNAPNPFNPRTTIRFELAQREHASLAIYDAAGRRVRTLVRTVLPAGAHQVAWDGRADDGSRVASGVYLCRMRSASGVQVRRMVLAR